MSKRACLTCGRLTTNGSRCTTCTNRNEAQRTRNRQTREPWRYTYRTPEWARARRQALARANHQCEVQGCTETRDLDVHHITPLRNGGHPTNQANLLVLCDNHHKQIEAATRKEQP